MAKKEQKLPKSPPVPEVPDSPEIAAEKQKSDWFLEVEERTGTKRYFYKKETTTTLRTEIINGKYPKNTSVTIYSKNKDGKWQKSKSDLFEFAKSDFKLGVLYRPVWSHAMTGIKWGIYAGIGLKCLDTFITLLRADVLIAILFLAAVGICFIPKVGIGAAVVVSLVMSRFTDMNLFFTFLAAALVGTILGALPGMAIGGIVGLVRQNSVPVVHDKSPESSSIVLKVVVLPLIGAALLFSLYFLVVNPWLYKTVGGAADGGQTTTVTTPVVTQTTKYTTNTTTVAVGSISGRVVDENKPISGANVNASDFGNTGLMGSGTTTDASGNYHITGLAGGDYRVQVSAAGKARKYWQNTNAYSSASPVNVTVSKDKSGINFTLEPSINITGKITDSGGKPLANVSVMISPAASGGISNVVVTDQNGVYSTANLGLPVGSYKVSAPAHSTSGTGDDGYATEYYNNKTSSSSADIITLTVSAPEAKGIDFVLDVGGSISGRVLDENKQPISGAWVYAAVFATGGMPVSSASTDASGNYHIMGLPSGDYRVYAAATGKVNTYWQNITNYSAASAVTVTVPGEKTGIDFTLAKGGTISGTVTNISGQPLANVSVRFTPAAGGGSFVAITNQNGVFTSQMLSFGSYKVNAPSSYKTGSSDGSYVINYYNNKPDAGSADLVTISAGNPNVNGINLTLN